MIMISVSYVLTSSFQIIGASASSGGHGYGMISDEKLCLGKLESAQEMSSGSLEKHHSNKVLLYYSYWKSL